MPTADIHLHGAIPICAITHGKRGCAPLLRMKAERQETDMAKLANSQSMVRMLAAAAAVASVLASAGPALAAPLSLDTSRGPAYITGNFGSLQTTTLPGNAGQGLLMNNGNGTSTLVAPGSLPQVVATPR